LTQNLSGEDALASRKGKPNYGGKSAIFAELKELAKFAGVRRPDLPASREIA
jgi:hypothetical protein